MQQYIRKGKPSQLGCDFYSVQTPLSDPQYRQSAFADSRLSESIASVQLHGRTQGHHLTECPLSPGISR